MRDGKNGQLVSELLLHAAGQGDSTGAVGGFDDDQPVRRCRPDGGSDIRFARDFVAARVEQPLETVGSSAGDG